MCWSAKGSLVTYLLSVILAAMSKGKLRPEIWYFMTLFSHMQLIEYFLWTYLKVPSLNAFWSAIGLLVILAEPLASLNLIPNKKWMLGYALGAAVYLLTQKTNFMTDVGANGHLRWNWVIPSWSIWMYGWMAAFLLPLLISKEYAFLAWALGTLLFSYHFNVKYGTTGSYWCWISVFTWLIVLLRPM